MAHCATPGDAPEFLPFRVSIERLDAPYFRDVFLEIALDADFQRNRAGRAPDARAMEPYLDNPVRGDVDQFEIPAVGLDRGSNEIEDAFYAVLERRFGLLWGGVHIAALRPAVSTRLVAV